MKQETFERIMKNVYVIAEENGSDLEFLVTITTKSGQKIKAYSSEIGDNCPDFVMVFTDDGYTFIPYENIETITV